MKLIITALLLILSVTANAQILVFVSSSMPIESVAEWMAQARVHGNTALIMNGLVNNSLPDTKAWVSRIIKRSHGLGGVSIDPTLFARYHITMVPAVVTNNKVIYGNVTLARALREANND